MKILIIQTGGTIDKDYPKKNKGYAFEIDEPAAARILENVEPGFEYEINGLLKKDSLDITDKDRAIIKALCEQADLAKIIITHGSDTLVDTARFIGNIPGKTIVLTGAYRPERFTNSDAAFNLGVAIGAINILDEGTFVAMNGKVMDPASCRKNPQTGRYEIS
ncbi:MAG: asparaginase domain-containing protein [Roseivirga sp.]